MSEIKVQCIDQAISFLNTPVISSGNVNYDRIVFDFCSRWDGYVKTAIFYRNKDEVYYQLLEGDSCLIPNEVLGEKGVVYIGVFGTQGDKTITSQVLTYRIQEGAVTEDLKPSDPTPDIYAQLVGRFAEFANELTDQQAKLDDFEERFNGSAGDAEKLGGQLPSYYASAQSVANLETNFSNGTTPAGNSNKLGGKSASEYALGTNGVADVASKLNVNSTKSVLELALTLESGLHYFTSSGATDLPLYQGTWGQGTIEVNTVGQKVVVKYEPQDTNRVFINAHTASDWLGWKELSTTADLANYLPKTSGVAENFNVGVQYSIGEAGFAFRKDGVNEQYFTYDKGNDILRRYGSDFSAKIMLDNGNVGSYALPLSGGQINGISVLPLILNTIANGAKDIRLPFMINGVLQGYLAFDGVNSPVFISNDGVNRPLVHSGNVGDYALSKDGGSLNVAKSLSFKPDSTGGSAVGNYFLNSGSNTIAGGVGMMSWNGVPSSVFIGANSEPWNTDNGLAVYTDKITWKTKDILHTGNSAKVVVSNTPLTAEGSVRVW